MRYRIYGFLVNRVPGIAKRYHDYHNDSQGLKRIISYMYLLWLNFAYYILHIKHVGKIKVLDAYEEKSLITSQPESHLFNQEPASVFVEKLKKYDVISFDLFDTLIFRPFSEPGDLFYILGQKLGYMDFKRIRIEAEKKARIDKYKKDKNYEVNLSEIWEKLESLTGIDAERGKQLEIETELQLCYANPYMKQVYESLLRDDKSIVITSDMYLPVDVLERILEKCGYSQYKRIYVSCQEKSSKWQGNLYKKMTSHQKILLGENCSIVHIGDNENSDYKMALKAGIEAVYYKNVNTNSIQYRSYDMSPIIGAAYRGIVNNHLYSGQSRMTMNQEYGFIYGGLFILGYCHFIHQYYLANRIDKILFLSRDGEIIKRAYDFLYPEDNTVYAYISRFAAAKWCAGNMKYDFVRKLVRHKVGKGKTIHQILAEMELLELEETLMKSTSLSPSDQFTSKNEEAFIQLINDNWKTIVDSYSEQRAAAAKWYKNLIGASKSALAVDIGWAGSGALALKTLFENEWMIDCKLTGIIAGTNSALNSEPDMSETMLLDGSLVSYMYSSRDNRDLWKKHNPGRGYNLFFELLTSSKQPTFKGFYYDSSGEVELKFGQQEPNPNGVEEIQEGIMEFVREYAAHFKDFPYMFNISGRDAYSPMLLAAGNEESYLRKIYSGFCLTEEVQ